MMVTTRSLSLQLHVVREANSAGGGSRDNEFVIVSWARVIRVMTCTGLACRAPLWIANSPTTREFRSRARHFRFYFHFYSTAIITAVIADRREGIDFALARIDQSRAIANA